MAITIDLAGQVALVTGGGRGVGRGITDRLLAAGATVAVVGRSEPDDLPGGVTFNAADVRDPDAAAAFIEAVVAEHGRLDIVVNNAGGSPSVAAADASPRFSTKIIELNLLSALHVAHAARSMMTMGVIVNVASLSALRPSPGTAAYGAAKAGLVNLTRTLAMEWAPAIRVCAVSAGAVRTEGFEDYYGGPEGAAAVEATIPMGRAASPTDVGDAVVFLASPLARYITGANLEVHGGGEALTLHGLLGP
ncbi:SDR family oxidoreductase [Iamia sp.]|uniref:SDR family oxidoreductase n=1 Tax=Iamia sp. TaxID=2722710 RepID=UPI002BDC93AE|nr:SDR family oxidoreductase [Iamia sp.]HXH58984.1 SDR family oxidoreductase [Iamia sp.]